MVKETIISLTLLASYMLSPQFTTQWRMDNPQLIKEAEVAVQEPESGTE